ncbi:MAG TPA: PEP-CTERM sorting domain-containing protein [Verrucomicrobiae bacterium]|nr:PEP-CTERM sorting domain-containing protein [Verrucomicrobiae bacterium]
MKHLKATSLLAGAVCLLLPSAHASLLFTDGFNYTAGSNLGGNINPGNATAWTGGNAALQIGSSGLSYPGFQGLGGNDLIYTSGSTATTSLNTFSTVTSGSIYYSFLIDATTLPTANNYITSLNPGTTGPGGSGDSMAVYVGANGSGWKIGVRNGNSGAAYENTVLQLNTTYLIVAELTLGTTPTVSLYLDPFPGMAQPGTPNATQTGTVAATSVDDVGFKAQSAATAGAFLIDDISLGTTWADVTVPEPSPIALAGLGVAGLFWVRRRR